MFNIGDKVVNAYGEEGTVLDRMLSEKDQKYYYTIKAGSLTENLVSEEKLKACPKENYDITVEIKILDNVVVGMINKEENGVKTEVARGHGHRIHEGSDGIIQAISYAFKKCWESINGGEVENNYRPQRNRQNSQRD
jgi:hypothetical protein